jgi:ABC-type nitrate/sulfonate/bicarbonate transport system substrate-binding protein
MRRSLELTALIATTAAIGFGCNDGTMHRTTTTTTETAPNSPASQTGSPANQGGAVEVDAGPNGAEATARTAHGGVDVNVGPNGGVGVDVQGEPIRDRLRERRAAREAATPR